MGVDVKAVCKRKLECIDPDRVYAPGRGTYNANIDAVDYPEHPFGALVMHALTTRWMGANVMLVDESEDLYQDYYGDIRDVTEDVVLSYNKKHGTQFEVELAPAIDKSGRRRMCPWANVPCPHV